MAWADDTEMSVIERQNRSDVELLAHRDQRGVNESETGACIARTIDAVAQAEVVDVSVAVLGELEAGFRVGGRYMENRRALTDFLHGPYVVIVR